MNEWWVAKAGLIWLAILALAFGNAAVRELVLIPRMGKGPGLVVSGVTLSLLVFLVAYASMPLLGARRPLELIVVGVGWCLLTIAFDLVMGHVQGKPVRELLDAYRFKDANLWPIVLLATLSAPYLMARLRGP